MKKKTLCNGKYRRFVSVDDWEYTERVDCTGIVAVMALTPEGKVLLVEQYRVPVASRVVEFPAGLVSDQDGHRGETFENAAKRELLEETGYTADHWVYVGCVPAASASASDMITVFRAYGLKKVAAGGGDHTESIIVHEIECGKINQWLRSRQASGALIDPKVYAGLYFLNNPEDATEEGKK